MLPETTMAPPPQAASVAATLGARGFVRSGRKFYRGRLSLARRERWFVFTEGTARARPSWCWSRGMGTHGFWKWVEDGTALHRVFELPAWVIAENSEDDRLDETGPASFDKLADWVLASRENRLPCPWHLPDAALVDSWLGHGGLLAHHKGRVRQAELILRPGCWALRMPVLPRLPEGLPEPRRRALIELTADAQRHWAMVRMGVPANSAPATLLAEVDFTGAPHSELLFAAGLAALKHAVAWVAETAEVLADPSIRIQCLAADSFHINPQNERKRA